MSFTAFGRGPDPDTVVPFLNRLNPNPNGHGSLPNSGGLTRAYFPQPRPTAIPNEDSNGNGQTQTNGNGHDQSLTNGRANGHGNGNGSRLPCFRASLSSGVSIKGIVKFRSELELAGEIEGTVEGAGRLTVSKNGHVR